MKKKLTSLTDCWFKQQEQKKELSKLKLLKKFKQRFSQKQLVPLP